VLVNIVVSPGLAVDALSMPRGRHIACDLRHSEFRASLTIPNRLAKMVVGGTDRSSLLRSDASAIGENPQLVATLLISRLGDPARAAIPSGVWAKLTSDFELLGMESRGNGRGASELSHALM
jgi:hypothetical protein